MPEMNEYQEPTTEERETCDLCGRPVDVSKPHRMNAETRIFAHQACVDDWRGREVVSMSEINKYRDACIEYARCRGEVSRIKHKIGEALAGCPDLQDDGRSQHLIDAYAIEYRGDGEEYYGMPYFVNHYDDVDGYLAGVCSHCHQAHLAIQEKKTAVKKFGIAQRRISNLGRIAGLSEGGGDE